MSLRVALIIFAPREFTLTAGQREINPTHEEPDESVEEILPFLQVGRAEGDNFHLSGALVENPDQIGTSLAIGWDFPDEEDPNQARVIDLSAAQTVVTTAPRKKADPGWRWQYRLESRQKSLQTNIYQSGFQPPFKASDVTLHLWHAINYNFDGYILARVDYAHRPPAYVESEWRIPKLEGEGFLED